MARLLLAALMCVGTVTGVEAQAPTSAQTPTRTPAPGRSSLMTMLDRSTEDTRRMLFFARQEVSEWGSAAIAPEHLLLGIIREGKGPAYELLFDKFALDVASLKAEIETHMERKPPLLLLGILSVSDSVPASILARHGVSLETARERL